MVNINIDAKTREYILKKGGIITIVRQKTGSCWAALPLPVVRLGEPEVKQRYNFFECNGIKVYIINSLKVNENQIDIRLKSFLGLKDFDVFGFQAM